MAAKEEKTFKVREVVKMMVDVSRKSANRLTVKLKGFIISADEYVKQDGSKGYRYTFSDDFSEGIVQFTSSRFLEKRKPAEIMVVLDGFTAYEPSPRGGAPAPVVAQGPK